MLHFHGERPKEAWPSHFMRFLYLIRNNGSPRHSIPHNDTEIITFIIDTFIKWI